MKYLRVRNWDKFQYRGDRPLPWIKSYDEVLDKWEYVQLTDAQRGLLHGLWLLANRTHNKIPDDVSFIIGALRLGQVTDTDRTGRGQGADTLRKRCGRGLDKLRTNGFIETWKPSRSHTAEGAPRAHRGRSEGALDRDRDKTKAVTASLHAGAPASNGTAFDSDIDLTPAVPTPKLKEMPS